MNKNKYIPGPSSRARRGRREIPRVFCQDAIGAQDHLRGGRARRPQPGEGQRRQEQETEEGQIVCSLVKGFHENKYSCNK